MVYDITYVLDFFSFVIEEIEKKIERTQNSILNQKEMLKNFKKLFFRPESSFNRHLKIQNFKKTIEDKEKILYTLKERLKEIKLIEQTVSGGDYQLAISLFKKMEKDHPKDFFNKNFGCLSKEKITRLKKSLIS